MTSNAILAARPLVVCAAALVLGACASTPAPAPAPRQDDPVQTAVHQAATELRSAQRIPGLAIGVVDGEHTRISLFGTLGADDPRPVTADTIFELGSVSKLFTATLAQAAEADGLLSLGDRPGRHLPWVRGTAVDEATLDQLGTYAGGGLPLQFPDGVTDEDSMRRYFAQWRPVTAPGSSRLYSNPSIGLLGRAAAAAYSADYPTALRENILGPLALHDSATRVPDEASAARYAWGSTDTSSRVRVSPGALDAEAYGVKSTAADMTEFVAIAARSGDDRPAARAVRAAMTARYAGGPLQQALGWESFPAPTTLHALQEGNTSTVASSPLPTAPADRRAPCAVDKTGSTNGFSAYVLALPGEARGVVLLANRNVPAAARVDAAHRILTTITAADGAVSCLR